MTRVHRTRCKMESRKEVPSLSTFDSSSESDDASDSEEGALSESDDGEDEEDASELSLCTFFLLRLLLRLLLRFLLRREEVPPLLARAVGDFRIFFSKKDAEVFFFFFFIFLEDAVLFLEEEDCAAFRGLRLAPALPVELFITEMSTSSSSSSTTTKVTSGMEVAKIGDGAGSLTPELNVSPRRRSARI